MRVPTVGRPEALASLFVVGAIPTLFLTKERWRLIALTAASGLIGATHPVGAVIFTMLLSGYFSFTHASRSACVRALAVGFGGIAISLTIIAVSPNGFLDTILGTAAHASFQIQRHVESWWELFHYLFFWWDRFFFFSLYLLILPAGLAVLLLSKKLPKSPQLFFASCILVALGVWYFGFRAPPTTYNLSMFFPVCAIALILLNAWLLRRADARRLGYGLAAATLLCGGVSSLAIVKFGIEFAYTKVDDRSYDEARALAESPMLSDRKCIYYDESLWVLFDHYDHLRQLAPSSTKNDSCADDDVPILVASGSFPFHEWKNAEVAFDNEDIVLDWRAAHRPEAFGITITKFLSGYSFYAIEGKRRRAE
jgi:hypothetical protein